MKLPNLPPLQARRFDIETLQYDALSLAKQADKGPTFLRHGGRVSYVVVTEELFDQLWPDPQRAWAVDEMPYRIDRLYCEALEAWLAKTERDDDQ